MNKETSRNPLLQAITEVLERDEEVQFAYLFGSTVKGIPTHESDIDVAVYLQPMDLKGFISKEEELTRALTLGIHNDRIDLRVLNVSPFLLQYKVLKDGMLIFSRNELERVDFETRVMVRFFELKPYLDEYTSLLKSRIRGTR